jgi:hypothetical protein
MRTLLTTLALALSLTSAHALPFDAATRARVRAQAIAQIREAYVDPAAADKIDAALRADRARLDAIADPQAYAERFSDVMQSVVPDRHLHIEYSPEPVPAPAVPGAADLAERRAQDERGNYGVERVERLPGNIGYVDLRAFPKTAWAADTLAAAMTLVAHTDALIIDLRHNGGGYPTTATLVESYLFDKRTHVVDVHWRDGDRTEQFWTQESVPGARFGAAKPVWILTSSATFSGAEQFAYDLKNLQRATVVGETTGGGANPGKFVALDEHFGLFVPTGRAISPITHGNWEGVGVVPDVPVAAASALDVAQQLALQALIAAHPAGAAHDEWVERLKSLR